VEKKLMPVHCRSRSLNLLGTISGLVLTGLVSSSVALAGGQVNAKKQNGPAIPGFARFYSNDKANAVEGGHLLLSTLNCLQCHLPKHPETTRDQFRATEGSYKAAPILDGVGTRIKRAYLREFLSDPQKTKPGTTMPNLFVGLDDAEKKEKIEALVHLLASTGTPAPTRADAKGIPSGRDLYHKVGCVACHGTRDAMGDEGELFASSVPLGNLKKKYTLDGLKAFLENPHQTRQGGRMPGLLTAKESNHVANYLMQGAGSPTGANMKYAYYEGSWQNLPDFSKLKAKAAGQASDFDLGVALRLNDCALKFEGFLKIDSEGTYTFRVTSDDGSKLWIDERLIVNNDGIHPPQLKSGKTNLAKGIHKLAIGVFNGGGGFELSVDVEGPGVASQPLGPMVYLTEDATKPNVAAENDPDRFAVQPKLLARGKEVFVSMGCANCHLLQNEKKLRTAPALEDLKTEGGCLTAGPKKGVPWYGLAGVQQKALQAALRSVSQKVEAKQVVAQTLTRMNCYACHERNQIGGVEDDLSNHFTSSLKEWGDEARLPPSLTGVGAKLNPAYFKKLLEQGSHDRSYMHTRMPRFGTGFSYLVEMFAKLDAAEKVPKVAFTEPLTKVKSAGRHMVGRQAFGCINCHNFGGVKTDGVQGIDMAIMTERLQKEWFHKYLVNPAKYRPGTRMPTSFPDGATPLKNVLAGKADAQIEAIWVYLADGKSATLPVGMNKQSIPLLPVSEAIIYRNFIQGAGTRAIGVGYPEHAHLAFDANDLRLAMIWQGAFIDARRHWTDRGAGFEPPMGDNVVHLPPGAPFFVLAKPDEAWPTKPARELGYKFRGYRLSDDQRPTFLYSFNEINIEDFPNAIETKANPAIRRSFTLTTDIPIGNLYYRAAVADKIEAEARGGWHQINDWRMRIESDARPVVRRSGKKMELLVPIRFTGNRAKFMQKYAW
jgi:cytochrome c2